jgi:hypothetical protein
VIDPVELRPLSLTKKVKSARLSMGGRKQLVFRLIDDNGAPVVLTAEPTSPPAAPAVFGAEKNISPAIVSVRLRAVDQYSDSNPQFDVTGEIILDGDCAGMVAFTLTQDDTKQAGIYKAEVGRFIGTGINQILIDTWPVYIAIEPSSFIQLCGVGPITVPEIRLGMGDMDMGELEGGEANLLDAEEFSDVEIMYCIRQCVDLWNESPPHVALFSVTNFQYRYHWIRGTTGLLYKIAAKKYARNQLNYQAGGISIDDQNKQQQYTAIAQELDQEFRDWMMKEKVRINMDLAWSNGL